MRTHITRSFEHANQLRELDRRLREVAKQVIGEVPLTESKNIGDAYPSGIPMNEELRLAIDDAELPLQSLSEAITWFEQIFGTEVAGPTPTALAQASGRGVPSASKY